MSLRYYECFVKTSPDDRVIGITLEELNQLDRIIALAGGKAKIKAIRGALNTGIIDLLITDKFTAERLVAPKSQYVGAE